MFKGWATFNAVLFVLVLIVGFSAIAGMLVTAYASYDCQRLFHLLLFKRSLVVCLNSHSHLLPNAIDGECQR